MIKRFTLSLIMILSVAATNSFAQKSKVKYGIKAGISLADWAISENSNNNFPDSKLNQSFFIGGNAEIAISNKISFQPGLTLIGKGFKVQEKETNSQNGEKVTEIETMEYNFMNIDIPLNFVAKFQAGKGKVFVGAGPYVSYALSGQMKMWQKEYTKDAGEYEETYMKMPFGSDSGEASRFDFGANILAGYELAKGYNVNLGYSLGFKNVFETGNNDKIQNRVITIGVGYSF
jgi:hypothetical protein